MILDRQKGERRIIYGHNNAQLLAQWKSQKDTPARQWLEIEKYADFLHFVYNLDFSSKPSDL